MSDLLRDAIRGVLGDRPEHEVARLHTALEVLIHTGVLLEVEHLKEAQRDTALMVVVLQKVEQLERTVVHLRKSMEEKMTELSEELERQSTLIQTRGQQILDVVEEAKRDYEFLRAQLPDAVALRAEVAAALERIKDHNTALENQGTAMASLDLDPSRSGPVEPPPVVPPDLPPVEPPPVVPPDLPPVEPPPVVPPDEESPTP